MKKKNQQYPACGSGMCKPAVRLRKQGGEETAADIPAVRGASDGGGGGVLEGRKQRRNPELEKGYKSCNHRLVCGL